MNFRTNSKLQFSENHRAHPLYCDPMLSHLSIKNYATVETLEIEFQPGMTVLTGETGVFDARIAIVLPVVALSAGMLSPVLIPIARWALVIRQAEVRVADADT